MGRNKRGDVASSATPTETGDDTARTRTGDPGADLTDGAYEPAAYWVPITLLHGWKDNPRVNAKAIPAVAASIKRFGFQGAIAVRKNGEILAGHTRVAAAESLGMPSIPVKFDTKLDPGEAHAFALADNKTAEIAEWDKDLLAAVVGQLTQESVDLVTGTGFSEDELATLLTAGELPPEGSGVDETNRIQDKFTVLVDCENDRDQAMLIDRLTAEGFTVRALVS